jgi:hypothetical protein
VSDLQDVICYLFGMFTFWGSSNARPEIEDDNTFGEVRDVIDTALSSLGIGLGDPLQTQMAIDEIEEEAQQEMMDHEADEDAVEEEDEEMGAGANSREERVVGEPDSVYEQAHKTFKHATTDGTRKQYKSAFNLYTKYFKSERKTPIHDFDPLCLDENTPKRIVEFIFMRCEPVATKNSEGVILGCKGQKYASAMTIRSALSYYFNQQYHCGDTKYKQTACGAWEGNPVFSAQVEVYMVSLRKRKVKSNEAPESARAIREEDIQAMFQHGMNQDGRNYVEFVRNHLMHVLSFLCLLRMDETTRIRLGDIELRANQHLSFTLWLRWRKCHQNGYTKPFVLYRNDHAEYLCPVRALTRYAAILKTSNMSVGYSGWLFCDANAIGTLILNKRYTYKQFLKKFRGYMKVIDPINYHLYGAHSFRRGGCQYFCCFLYPAEERWNFLQLCEWGGWSMSLTSLTIVRYLVSDLDPQSRPRESYMRHVRVDE